MYVVSFTIFNVHTYFPVSHLVPVPWQPTSWPLVDTIGADRTQTLVTTLRVISPPTMREYRCCCLTGSWDSSWSHHRPPGIITSWVSFTMVAEYFTLLSHFHNGLSTYYYWQVRSEEQSDQGLHCLLSISMSEYLRGNTAIQDHLIANLYLKSSCRAPDKRDIEHNSKKIFLISQWKHMLWHLIRIVSVGGF